ncbi:MAG: S8 family serine peptidase [Alphaproteobacteria bacterium]|nr:S8 family serine peptidase [Alphaproteobacteria bacterium]
MFAVRMILIAAISTAPVAAYADCANPIYKKNHPYECRTTSKAVIGAGLALAGAAAIGGAAMSLDALGGAGSGGATPQPTMNTYDYVGGDVSASHIASVISDTEYSRNHAQYDSIRLAYSLARGITGKNSTIAVLDADSWHGASVAAIAAGPIAPDAVIEKYYIAGANNKFISYGEIGNIISAAAHADIINASWNTEMRANAVRTRAQLAGLTDQNFINSLADAARGGTIFVWAAGNEGAAESGALSALPRVIPEMQGHFINVVAWDDNTGALADYSNACGVTMEYCITAPGTNIATEDRTVSGTSFAAPVVSAAVAVLREAFPYMTAPQITHLLFTTARDLGAPGVDAVYGHGMLDLERATRPVGAELVPLASGGTAPLNTTRVSGAIGRKLKNSDLKLAFIDDYGRAFETTLSDHVKIKNHGRGYEHLRPGITSAHAGIIEFGFRRSDFLAAEGLLGTDERNIISFIAINSEFDIGKAKISFRPEIGAARPRGRTDSMITKFSGIYTASIATKVQHGDWTIGLAIPDIILAGDMDMRLPVGRSANGGLLFQDAKTSLTGRTAVEYSLSYKFVTAAFVDNPIGTDEFFILAKHKLAF